MEAYGPFGTLLINRIQKMQIFGNLGEGSNFIKRVITFYIKNIIHCKVKYFQTCDKKSPTSMLNLSKMFSILPSPESISIGIQKSTDNITVTFQIYLRNCFFSK